MKESYNQLLAKKAIEIIREDFNPEHIFSVREIVNHNLIPWANNRLTIMRIIKSGALKAKITQGDTPKNNRYDMKMENIISYLKKYSNLK